MTGGPGSAWREYAWRRTKIIFKGRISKHLKSKWPSNLQRRKEPNAAYLIALRYHKSFSIAFASRG